MTITTLSGREFNQDTSRARRAGQNRPGPNLAKTKSARAAMSSFGTGTV